MSKIDKSRHHLIKFKMIKKFLLIALTIFCVAEVSAQQLLSPSFTFSHKKTAYLILKDGVKLEGRIKDIDRKKGLIKYIKIVDEAGQKHKLKPTVIESMYLPASRLDKLSKSISFISNMQKWKNPNLNQDLLHKGYVYCENTQVMVKKKERTMMLQLLNPEFSNEVRVYHDPRAKHTMGIGVAGISVTGNIAKSYYVKKADEDVAHLIKKNKYEKEFAKLWGGCDSLIQKTVEINWRDLTQHILDYSECNN